MKKVIISLLCIIFLMSSVVMASSDITIKINGKDLKTDVAPCIVNGRTFLPMRAVFEAFGANVNWVEEDKLIFATKGETMMILQIGNDKMSVQKISSDNNNVITLDAPPFIENGRTMVPVRAIAECLNANVEWDNNTRTVIITK